MTNKEPQTVEEIATEAELKIEAIVTDRYEDFTDKPEAVREVIRTTLHQAIESERESFKQILDTEFYGISKGTTRFYDVEDANNAIRRVYKALTPDTK